MILLVSATEKEIGAVKKIFGKKNDIIFLTTGIGILNVSYTLHKFLSENSYNKIKIIVAGIGGGFRNSNVKINDLCIADSEILGDFGVCYHNKIEYKFENRTINLENNFFRFFLNNFRLDSVGKFVTVNCVSTEKMKVNFFQKKFSPVCENMEGYAAAFIAEKFGLEMVEIRVISNYAGYRDGWETDSAVDKLNDFLSEYLSNGKLY